MAFALGRDEDQLNGLEGIQLDLECGFQPTVAYQKSCSSALSIPHGVLGRSRSGNGLAMPADDTRLLSMLGEIAKGALCEDDLECPLSATVGRLLPPNAQDHDPHVEMLSNRCEGTRAGVEAKTQAKFEMQQQLQAELRDIQQRLDCSSRRVS